MPSMGSQRVGYYRVSFSSYKKYLYVCVCLYVYRHILIHMLAVVVSIKSTLIVNIQPQGNSYLKPSNQKPTSQECKVVQPL